MPPIRAALLLALAALLAGCAYVRPSPVGTNCVHMGRNTQPVCTDG